MYDLGIIGGGPAGYTAALHATSNGKKVVLFEQDKVGGTCLNRGCIPTKAILHSAEVFEEMKNAENLGLSAENVLFDYEKVVERKDKIVEKLRDLSTGTTGQILYVDCGCHAVYASLDEMDIIANSIQKA